MREYFKVTSPGASGADLAELQARLGHALPDEYLSLLRETDGAEWCIHDVDGDCLRLWKAPEVLALNEDYQIQRWLPNVMAIGSDGEDSAIVFDRLMHNKPNQWPLFLLDFGALDREEFIPVAPNFLAWVESEFRLLKRS